MTDLTPQFNQCVDIVTSEFHARPKQQHRLDEAQYKLKDTFYKESFEFYQVLVNLNAFISSIKTDYLAISESKASSMTKDKIDEDFNVKIQQCFKKLALLETYETKRQEMVLQNLPKRWFSFGFGDDGEDAASEQVLYFDTIAKHRMQILRFLMESLNYVSKKFETMQRKRASRERQLNLLEFQNIDDDDDDDDYADNNVDDLNLNESEIFTNLEKIQQNVEVEQDQEDENVPPTLSQQQLQELEVENKELLNMKNTQLKQVDKIQHSILDIINIQNELSFKLQEQGDLINNLIDAHSEVEMEVTAGNKTLNKATKKNKRGANYLVVICIALGCLLVIIDFLKFI